MSFSDLMDSKRCELYDTDGDQDISLNMAAAAIMFAVIAADEQVDSVEVADLIAILRKRYGLADEELIDIMSAARRAVSNEREINGFLLLLRENLNSQERTQLLDDMWELAYSNKTIHATESLAIDHFAKKLNIDSDAVSKARDIAKQKLELYLG